MSSWETLLEQKEIGKQLDLSVGSKEKKITQTALNKVCTLKTLTSLSLSGHALKDLPEDFGLLTELEKLDLSKNEFKSLGPVSTLCKLKDLSLKLNQFATFPKEILKYHNLEKLDLSFNNIKQVTYGQDIVTQILAPKKPVHLPPIKHINMSYNELSKFPLKLLDFKGLTHLELSRNHFGDDIPSALSKFQDTLKVLILDEIGMTKFPQEVLHLMYLEKLSLCKNSIREFPHIDKMLNLASLKELYMNGCEILRWSSLTILCKLQVLHLNDNGIASIPYEAKHLLSLRELRMSKNKIEDIPSHIEFLQNLEIVDFSNNKIESIDPAIGNLVNLKFINMSNNSLTLLPVEISNLLNVEEMDVSMNKIKAIPSLSKWSKVKNLILKNNRIGSIPPGVSECKALESLDMTMNCVRKIDEVWNCPSLINLRLKHNGIEIIPPEIAGCTNLVDFNLDNNGILKVPIEITSLTKLKSLNLSFNSPVGIKRSDEVKAFMDKNAILFTEEFEFCSKILDGVYLGSAAAASNKHHLKELGITHVITVAHDIPAPHPELFSYLMVYVEDIRAATILPHFDDINLFIDEARMKNEGVMIHCMAGRSRSATVTCSYLQYHKRMKLKEAYQAMKRSRNIVEPNETFKKELKQYERYLSGEKETFRPKNNWELINVDKNSQLHKVLQNDLLRLKMPKFVDDVTNNSRRDSKPTTPQKKGIVSTSEDVATSESNK